MATSGTNTFSVSRDEVIKASLRLLNVIGVGETPIQEDYQNCSEALNIMIKSWAKKSFPLWVYQRVAIPMIVDNASYQIGPTATGTGAIVMSKPLRIMEAYLRNPNDYDTDLMIISRQEYDILGDKAAQGIPNQLYYDDLLTNGIVYVYNVPSGAGYTVYALCQRMFEDMSTGTNDFDFPKEWFQALKWGLADELSEEYEVPEAKIIRINAKAEAYIKESFDWSVEEASVYFSVNSQQGQNNGRTG